MKRNTVIGLLIGLLLLSISAAGQEEDKKPPKQKAEKDTLKIKAGDREILIIKDEKIADEIETLKNGKLEFKQNIAMLKDSIRDSKTQKRNAESSEKEKEYEEKIKDYEKQIEAMEKGIERIEEEIADIEGKGNDDEGDDFDFGPDFEKDFDWPFNKDKTEFDGHWDGIELGLNNFMNADYGFQPQNDNLELDGAKSWTFSINIMEFDLALGTEKAGLTTGLGFKLNSYYLQRPVTLDINGDNEMVLQETGLNYDKNKLNIWYLRIPLLLEFQFPAANSDSKLYFGGGATGGLRIGAKNKTIYTQDGIDHENYSSHNFNIHSFRYAFRGQIGYDFIHLFAEYSPMTLFDQDNYKVYPVSVGLKIVNF